MLVKWNICFTMTLSIISYEILYVLNLLLGYILERRHHPIFIAIVIIVFLQKHSVLCVDSVRTLSLY